MPSLSFITRNTILLSAFCVCFLLNTTLAQPYWATKFGGTGSDQVNDMKLGADGNLYVVGEFSTGMDVGSTSLNSAGATDCFVAKCTPAGDVVWIKKAGGGGVDRALKLAVDASGTLAVTGVFMGTADLFGTSCQSAGGTLDIFVAKLNAATGDAVWVRTGGSPAGSDVPNGISLSPNGTITMAGEFRGQATFSGNVLNSMVDPYSLQPSTDVVVVNYASNGTCNWVQQGAAKYTDRAIDVVSDANNNLYVCGQFSDTVTFDAVHDNAMYNAVFVMKLDASGTEQWFRKCGGATLDLVHDMLLTDQSDLLLCGDLQGTMVYVDDQPHLVIGGDPFAYYLLRIGLDGHYMASSVLGSENPVVARCIDQRADTIAVYGEFKCQFTDLSTHYNGDGLFMATGDNDLFICKHRFSSLQFQEAQQFGGQHSLRAGGITSLSDGALVFAGRYEHLLVMPGDGTFWGDVWSYNWLCDVGLIALNVNATYCGDTLYGAYNALRTNGLGDGFLTLSYVRNRAPYDMWNRSDETDCVRSVVKPCIQSVDDITRTCADTTVICYCEEITMMPSAYFSSATPFSYEEEGICDSTGYIGIDVSYQWSTGEHARSITPQGSGLYWCTVSSLNGCWSWTDSSYVLLQCVIPLVSDELGVNVNSDIPVNIQSCGPFWIWSPDVPNNYGPTWTANAQGIMVAHDSILVTVSGEYTITLNSANGCHPSLSVPVTIHPTIPLPNITGVDLALELVSGGTLGQDTAYVCPTECPSGSCTPTWYVDGVEAELPPGIVLTVTSFGVTQCDEGSFDIPANEFFGWSVLSAPGWQTLDLDLSLNNEPCLHDALHYTIHDSVFVQIVPAPQLTVDAPERICPGDTVPLITHCTGCDTLLWYGPSFTGFSSALDTAYTDEGGEFIVATYHRAHGKECGTGPVLHIEEATPPNLYMDPTLICPSDSSVLSTDLAGSDYQWIGPNGFIATDASAIQVHDFGDYYLTMTDVEGCVLGNGPIALNAFGSPYLDVQPEQVLCPYETGSIEVQTNDPLSIVWDAPFSGHDTLQTITQPGTYSCSVTSCGTTYALNVVVIGGHPDASVLDAGPIATCDTVPVELLATADQALYLWEPTEQVDMAIFVHTTSDHQLITFDEFGCSDTSAVIHVEFLQSTALVLDEDTALCNGQHASLFVPAGYSNVLWSNGALSDTIVVSGPGTYTVQVTQANGCVVNGQVVVSGGHANATVLDPGPFTQCGDGSVTLDGTPGQFAYLWQPGQQEAQSITVSSTGQYQLITFDELGCSDTSAVVLVQFFTPTPLVLDQDTAVCADEPVHLHVSQGLGSVHWNTGAITDSITVLGPGVYTVQVTDANGCVVNGQITVSAALCGMIIPNIFTPNGDGENDAWMITGHGDQLLVEIRNRWGQVVYTGDPQRTPWDGRVMLSGDVAPEGVYFYTVSGTSVKGSPMKLTGHIQLVR